MSEIEYHEDDLEEELQDINLDEIFSKCRMGTELFLTFTFSKKENTMK